MKTPFLIWQVHFDAFAQNMLLELREEKTGEIYFLVIFFDDDTQNFRYETDESDKNAPKIWQMTERFWLTIKKLQYNLVFVQHYPDHTRPEMVGIWVIDIFSKNIVWKEPLAKFVEVENDKILYHIQDKKYTQYIFEEKDFLGHKSQIFPTKTLYPVLFPEYYTQDLAYFGLVKDFLQKYFVSEVPLYELAYLETENYLFIGYYFEQNISNKIHNKASYCIFDKKKKDFISKKDFDNIPTGFVRFWLYDNYWVYTPTYQEICIEKIINF